MTRPEIGRTVRTGDIDTNCLEAGDGAETVLLIHGSGPGVTAYANWRLVLPELSTRFRVLAPDLVGFGHTDRPDGTEFGLGTWARQVLDLLDALDVERVHLVGNSLGGAIALQLAAWQPERVGRLVLMGSMGVDFALSDGLDRVWGYQPSLENMRAVLNVFAHSREIVDDELARVRYEASIRPGVQEAFAAMFPAPRQRWVDALAIPEDELKRLPHRTLLVHGREDQVIPPATSHRLAELLDNADLTVFAHCGHWSMIERATDFNRIVLDFLS